MQAVKALPSRLQPKVLPASVDVKLKIALVLFVNAAGLEVILVPGGLFTGNNPSQDTVVRINEKSIWWFGIGDTNRSPLHQQRRSDRFRFDGG